MARKKRTFIKAAETTTKPEKSRAEIDAMLRRYGASAFSYASNYETGEVRLEFVIPEGDARVPVRIPINTLAVFNRLYGDDGSSDSYDLTTARSIYNGTAWARAERVAWRNLVLWIDAALSSASIGLRSIAETFAADRLVTTESGSTVRLAELIERNGQTLGASRLLMLGKGPNG